MTGWHCPICGRWEDGTGPCAHTRNMDERGVARPVNHAHVEPVWKISGKIYKDETGRVRFEKRL